MGSKSGLGEFEQVILVAVLRLGERAFGPEIAGELEDAAGRSVTRGALYSTLNRLETKGFLSWAPEEPGEVRRGHIRRKFSVTPEGLEALRRHRETMLSLWSGVEALIDRGHQ